MTQISEMTYRLQGQNRLVSELQYASAAFVRSLQPAKKIIPPARIRTEDQPFVHAVAENYQTPDWPKEELCSVVADVLRLMRGFASKYCDPTCVELNAEELEAECRRKFIERLEQGDLRRIKTRGKLFGWIKTVLSNLVLGIVGKCRFTVKRTGRRVPSKRSGLEYDRSFKPEVSLDGATEDERLNRAVERAASITDDYTLCEFDADMSKLLSAAEFLVYRQLTQPNTAALTLASLEIYRGIKPRQIPMKVDVTTQHLADGLGLPLELFKTIVLSVRQKTKKYMSMPTDSGVHTAVTALEKIFDIRVPRSSEPLVVKRIFTLKARAEYQKVNPDVSELLRMIGAKVPTMDQSQVLNCYGVLWQASNPVCRACDLFEACRIEAANFGMDGVALSHLPKIMPPRAVARTAIKTDGFGGRIVPGELPSDDLLSLFHTGAELFMASMQPRRKMRADLSKLATTAEEARLQCYLEDNFAGFFFNNERYYAHKTCTRPVAGVSYLFWLGQKDGRMRVRFCTPSPGVKSSLVRDRASYFLPIEMPFDKAIRLIDQQATEKIDLTKNDPA